MSSESEDEKLKMLEEAVDPTMFSDSFFKHELKDIKKEPKIELKSQRNLEIEENIYKSEINISDSMKEFIGNKLSKLIDAEIEFVPVKSEIKEEETPVPENIRLLSDCKEYVKNEPAPEFCENRKKVPIKRRCMEDSHDIESIKIQKVAVTAEAIQNEIKSWSIKPKHQVTEYKSIKGIGYIREPSNEFTKLRNKNNWTESKIKSSKYFNRPMNLNLLHKK